MGCWLLFSLSGGTAAGSEPATGLPARFTDRLQNTTSEAEAALLLEEYLSLEEHKIPYSRLGRRVLHSLPALEEAEITAILEVIRRHPDAESWEPFENVLPEEVVEILRYAVSLPKVSTLSGQARWRMKTNHPNAVQWYSRWQGRAAGRITGSLVVERDPGERSLVDHVAGGVEFHDTQSQRRLIAGEFRLGYGQGLSFGRSMSLSKSGSVIRNADRSNTRLRVNASSLESAGFTGLAGEASLHRHTVRGFIAASPRDGEWEGTGVRLSTSGLHLTSSARHRQNALLERLTGVGYWFSASQYVLGFQGASLFYRKWRVEKKYARQTFGSFWISTPWMVHETAFDGAGHPAHYTAVRRQIGPADFTFGYRYYHPDYSAPFARGFQEYTQTANETGLYAGIRWDLGRVRWQWYFDQFRELRARENPRRSGTEWLTRGDWRPAPRMLLTLQVRAEDKEVYDSQPVSGVPVDRTARLRSTRYRARWKYRWPTNLRLEVRVDLMSVSLHRVRKTGTQWAFQMEYPLPSLGGKVQVMLVPYRVRDSAASTYFFVMPALGTMQILRQTGDGILLGTRLSVAFSPDARGSIFYLQRRLKHLKLSRILCGQLEIAF